MLTFYSQCRSMLKGSVMLTEYQKVLQHIWQSLERTEHILHIYSPRYNFTIISRKWLQHFTEKKYIYLIHSFQLYLLKFFHYQYGPRKVHRGSSLRRRYLLKKDLNLQKYNSQSSIQTENHEKARKGKHGPVSDTEIHP
jgi:hypothetical protein